MVQGFKGSKGVGGRGWWYNKYFLGKCLFWQWVFC